MCLHSLLSITCNFQQKIKVTHLRKTCRISSICSIDKRKKTPYNPICLLHLKWLLRHSGASGQLKLSRQLLEGNAAVKCEMSHWRAKITFLSVLPSAAEEGKYFSGLNMTSRNKALGKSRTALQIFFAYLWVLCLKSNFPYSGKLGAMVKKTTWIKEAHTEARKFNDETLEELCEVTPAGPDWLLLSYNDTLPLSTHAPERLIAQLLCQIQPRYLGCWVVSTVKAFSEQDHRLRRQFCHKLILQDSILIW